MPTEPQTVKVAQEISQTIDSQDDTIQLETADQPTAEDDATPDTKEKVVAGYAASDLLNAPIKPPEPKVTEGPEETGNRKVALLVAGGIVLFVLGVLLALVGYLIFGILLIVAAALLVIVGVFLPIR